MRVALWLLQDSIKNWSNWIAGFYYVKHALESLCELPVEQVPEVVAFVPRSLEDRLVDSIDQAKYRWLTIEAVPDDWLESPDGRLQIEAIVRSHRCDLLFPALTPPIVPVDCKVIGWIADYQHKCYPGFFSSDELAYRDRLFSFLSSTCSRIVSSSHVVQEDYFNFFRPSRDNGFVLQFAASPPQQCLVGGSDCGVLEKLGIKTPYAYLPYQFWIHKNHRIVFEAWKSLNDRGNSFTLVCSGATNDSRFPGYFAGLQAFLEQSGIADSVKILGLVDRHDQWQLYRHAKMILQPSLFEGWSTSVEESRSVGKAVVLSDIAVHREQLSSTGHFFDPADSHALAEVVLELWSRLPEGLDLTAEQTALDENKNRISNFGRNLISLFDQVYRSDQPNIAAQTLPLYLYMQSEAQQRLAVIETLSAHIEYLNSVVANLGTSSAAEAAAAEVGDRVSGQSAEKFWDSRSWGRSWFRKRA